MTIVNQSGETVFDTDEGLFVVTDRISGRLNLNSRTATNPNNGNAQNWVNVTRNHSISNNINSEADTVRGVFEISVGGSPQGWLANVGAFNAGGSYLHFYDANYLATQVNVPEWDLYNAASMVAYTFLADNGSLDLEERVVLVAQADVATISRSITLKAVTIDYDLFVGTFV